MRRYQLSVNDNPYEIVVEELSATEYQVTIDGERVDVTLNEQEDLAGAPITPAVAETSAPSRPVARKAPQVPQSIKSAPKKTPSPAVSGGVDLAYSMTAPMPGVILQINCQPGDSVDKGDVVMVLEAMKMNNDLHASRSGVIASVNVAAGDQVKYGQTLLQFEKE